MGECDARDAEKQTFCGERTESLQAHFTAVSFFLPFYVFFSALLNVRVFDEATKKAVYAQQTAAAKEKGESNCPLCAIGHDANHTQIWDLKDMDADHVTAWSKGEATDIENCQMLFKTHNRAKGKSFVY